MSKELTKKIEVISKEIFDKQVVSEVRLFLHESLSCTGHGLK